MITQVNCSWINKVDGGTALTQGPSEKLLELFSVEKVSDSQLTNPEFGPFILFLEEIVHWCLCSMVSEYFFIGIGISSHTSLITGYSELGNGRMKGGCPNEQKPASVKKWSLVKCEPWVETLRWWPSLLGWGEGSESDFRWMQGQCRTYADRLPSARKMNTLLSCVWKIQGHFNSFTQSLKPGLPPRHISFLNP